MSDTDKISPEQSGVPTSFDDFAKFAAKENLIDESRLRSAMSTSSPSRADLIDVIWVQARQNMVLLETVVAILGNDHASKVTHVENLIKTMREGFNRMYSMSGDQLKAGLRDAGKENEENFRG